MWDGTSKKFRLYDTPNQSDMVTLVFSIPESLKPFLLGAIARLAAAWAWRHAGSMTPEEASEHVSRAIAEVRDMVGLVIASTHTPEYALLCDGSTYARNDYPRLWSVLPSSMKTADTFTVPDLREKFVRGAHTSSDAGLEGGSDTHTITIAQLPRHAHTTQPHSHTNVPHSHTYAQPTFGIDIESVGVPDPTGVGNPPVPSITTASIITIDDAIVTVNTAGDDEPIPTVPAFYSLIYVIVAS